MAKKEKVVLTEEEKKAKSKRVRKYLLSSLAFVLFLVAVDAFACYCLDGKGIVFVYYTRFQTLYASERFLFFGLIAFFAFYAFDYFTGEVAYKKEQNMSKKGAFDEEFAAVLVNPETERPNVQPEDTNK
jgi:hypothetical protein